MLHITLQNYYTILGNLERRVIIDIILDIILEKRIILYTIPVPCIILELLSEM